MKFLFAILLVAASPGLVLGQTQAPAKPAAKSSAKPEPKPTRPAAKPVAEKKLTPEEQKAVEEATLIDEDPSVTLTEPALAIAKKIFVGTIPCELGAYVIVSRSRREGFFVVATRGHRYVMHPEVSRTGAIRLEDPKRGAMWLQLSNKSMLMSQKLGQRLADECQHPDQATVAEALKRNPAPSLLETIPQELTAPGAAK